jgi:hypothetical protein
MDTLTELFQAMTGSELLLLGVLVALSLDLMTYIIEDRFYLPFTILTVLSATALLVYEFQVRELPDLGSGALGPITVISMTLVLTAIGCAARRTGQDPVDYPEEA